MVGIAARPARRFELDRNRLSFTLAEGALGALPPNPQDLTLYGHRQGCWSSFAVAADRAPLGSDPTAATAPYGTSGCGLGNRLFHMPLAPCDKSRGPGQSPGQGAVVRLR
jgi:hypothetical protein